MSKITNIQPFTLDKFPIEVVDTKKITTMMLSNHVVADTECGVIKYGNKLIVVDRDMAGSYYPINSPIPFSVHELIIQPDGTRIFNEKPLYTYKETFRALKAQKFVYETTIKHFMMEQNRWGKSARIWRNMRNIAKILACPIP